MVSDLAGRKTMEPAAAGLNPEESVRVQAVSTGVLHQELDRFPWKVFRVAAAGSERPMAPEGSVLTVLAASPVLPGLEGVRNLGRRQQIGRVQLVRLTADSDLIQVLSELTMGLAVQYLQAELPEVAVADYLLGQLDPYTLIYPNSYSESIPNFFG